MRYLSICSGIEAATVAWHPLGWQPVGFSEIEPFPSAVLAHHYPDIPNLGDMTKHNEWTNTLQPNLIVGGTPCQAFSIAGLRKGLADPRGNLTLTFLSIIEQYRPKWVVWENVPGVLSEASGAFGSFLGGLGQLGYGFAYRVLDAQYFGVAQRRRRVFVVGHLGDWRPAAAVLFERESLSGHPAPSRKTREGSSRGTEDGTTECCEPFFLDRASFNQGENAQYQPNINQNGVSDALVAKGPHAVSSRQVAIGEYVQDDTASTMCQRDYKDATDLVTETYRVTFNDANGTRKDRPNGGLYVNKAEISNSLTQAQNEILVKETLTSTVRRLTPTECERLQGFPDGHTLIPWRGKPTDQCPDGPRYKALGNSMAVPVMAWIGKRIQTIETLTK